MWDWENTLKQAKKAYYDKAFITAITLNQQALAIAKSSLTDTVNLTSPKVISSIMVSYLSLADSYIKIMDFANAYQVYQRSLYFLQKINKQPGKTVEQTTAIFNGAIKLQMDGTLFCKRHRHDISSNQQKLQDEFQLGLADLIAPRASVH